MAMFVLLGIWMILCQVKECEDSLLCWQDSHFWNCITFCKRWHGHSDSVTKPDYHYNIRFLSYIVSKLFWNRRSTLQHLLLVSCLGVSSIHAGTALCHVPTPHNGKNKKIVRQFTKTSAFKLYREFQRRAAWGWCSVWRNDSKSKLRKS